MSMGVLNQRQRVLLHLQRQCVISSDSEEVVQSDYAEYLQCLNHEEPFVKVFALGKIHKAISRYEEKKLSALDRYLLKGFYVANRWELEQDPDHEKQAAIGQTKCALIGQTL